MWLMMIKVDIFLYGHTVKKCCENVPEKMSVKKIYILYCIFYLHFMHRNIYYIFYKNILLKFSIFRIYKSYYAII